MDPQEHEAGAFSPRARLKSFVYAGRGIATMLRSQHNAWIHAIATVVVVAAGLAFDVTRMEWVALVFAIVAVWTAEALNTAFEFLCDVASPEFHPMVEKAKDVAAGAVLMCAVGAVVIAALVFGPHFTTSGVQPSNSAPQMTTVRASTTSTAKEQPVGGGGLAGEGAPPDAGPPATPTAAEEDARSDGSSRPYPPMPPAGEREALRRAIRKGINSVRFCYETALRESPNMKTRIDLRFSIRPDGSVEETNVDWSNTDDPVLDACVAAACKTIQFSARKDGRPFEFVYPFHAN